MKSGYKLIELPREIVEKRVTFVVGTIESGG
jgi:predicted ATPase